MEVKDFVFETFLRLTSKTVPYGDEDTLMKEVGKLFPDGLQKDVHGNYFYKVGDSRTIFASHLDTVSSKYETVTHVFDGDIIRTDGKTTLGADDKAGTTVMLAPDSVHPFQPGSVYKIGNVSFVECSKVNMIELSHLIDEEQVL